MTKNGIPKVLKKVSKKIESLLNVISKDLINKYLQLLLFI
jgi:hypothetical protein